MVPCKCYVAPNRLILMTIPAASVTSSDTSRIILLHTPDAGQSTAMSGKLANKNHWNAFKKSEHHEVLTTIEIGQSGGKIGKLQNTEISRIDGKLQMS